MVFLRWLLRSPEPMPRPNGTPDARAFHGHDPALQARISAEHQPNRKGDPQANLPSTGWRALEGSTAPLDRGRYPARQTGVVSARSQRQHSLRGMRRR
jgi:hypothetical protein